MKFWLRSLFQSDQSAERLLQIQKTFSLLKRDVEQVVLRPIRDEYGSIQPAFMAAQHGRYRLELTRGGYYNPGMENRSSLQRVAYSLEENTLQRLTWRHLDRAQDAEPVVFDLLKDVRSIEFKFRDIHKELSDSWPPINTTSGVITDIPLAMEIILELEDWGRLRRVFLLPGQ